MSKVTSPGSDRYFSAGGMRGNDKQMSFCRSQHIRISVKYGLGVVVGQDELDRNEQES